MASTPTIPPKSVTTHTVTTSDVVRHRTPDYLDISTLLLPALTFIAGYILNHLIEKGKEKKRLKRVKVYYFSLLNTLVAATARQVTALREAAQRLEDLTGGDAMIAIVTRLRTERIRAVADIDLFTLFVGESSHADENTIHLNAISGTLDYVEAVKPRIELVNKDTFEHLSGFSKQFELDKAAFMKSNHEVIINHSTTNEPYSPDIDKLLEVIDAIIKQNSTELVVNPTILNNYNLFVKPIYDGTREVGTNNETYTMLALLDKMNGNYAAFGNYRVKAVREMRKLASDLDTARIELSRAIENLR